jgi:hypothetical protein
MRTRQLVQVGLLPLNICLHPFGIGVAGRPVQRCGKLGRIEPMQHRFNNNLVPSSVPPLLAAGRLVTANGLCHTAKGRSGSMSGPVDEGGHWD